MTELNEELISNSLKLNINHKKILVGLCHFGGLISESDIAQQMNIKRSTFSTIKQRLHQNDLINEINLLNFYAQGGSLLSIVLSKIIGGVQMEDRIESVKEILSNSNNILQTQSETDFSKVLTISKNFSDFLKTQVNIEENFSSFLQNREHIHFPLENSKIYRFKNFSYSLAYEWKLDGLPVLNEPFIPNTKISINYSELAWDIFHSFLKYPSLSITELAEKLERPENTIRKYRKIFHSDKMIFPIYIPNLISLGFKLELSGLITLEKNNEKQIDLTIDYLRNNLFPKDLIQSYNFIYFSSVFTSYSKLRKQEINFFDEMTKAGIKFTYSNRSVSSLENEFRFKTLKNSLPNLLRYLNNELEVYTSHEKRG